MKFEEEKKFITIGICGHVDHGKTSLTRCLTGIDTDRWSEEKRRGLTIESGIAVLELSQERQIALVDVPGHSDYLKNTIRGLSSVDMAILVVAADEGVMPQTLEHISLLNFFGVRSGFVVLSKVDLVDEENIELATLELKEALKETFLKGKPLISFSAIDQRGIDKIRVSIEDELKQIRGKFLRKPFRLWIDQVWSFPGFGTVVCGTIISGCVKQGEILELLPSKKEVRARFMEVHHQRVQQAFAGQRVGINLPKLAVSEVNPGMMLAEIGIINPSKIFNAELSLIPEYSARLKNRDRVKLYLGTSVTNAHIIIMNGEMKGVGEKYLVQFQLERPIPVLPQDSFVICPLNLNRVVGGGTVLEIDCEKFRRAKAEKILPFLQALQKKDVGSVISLYFNKRLVSPITIQKLTENTGFSNPEVEKEIKKGIEAGRIIDFGDCRYFSKERYLYLKNQVLKIINDTLSQDPLKPFITSEEIKGKLVMPLDDVVYKKIIADLLHEGSLIKEESGYKVKDLSVALSFKQEEIVNNLLKYAQQSGLVHFSADTFWKAHQCRFDKNEIEKMLNYLCANKRLIRLNNGRFISTLAMEEIKKRVKEAIIEKGKLTIADCREILGYGRTGGIPVLEYLDGIGFTFRRGNERFLKGQNSQ